jgi:hypothetical protein
MEILQGYSSSSVPNAIMSANFVLAQRKWHKGEENVLRPYPIIVSK